MIGSSSVQPRGRAISLGSNSNLPILPVLTVFAACHGLDSLLVFALGPVFSLDLLKSHTGERGPRKLWP